MSETNRYAKIIERIFHSHFKKGMEEFGFEREELETLASELGVKLPKNLGDLIYSFKFRTVLPASILALAPKGRSWVIRQAGRGKYCFIAAIATTIAPNTMMAETKIPDATPGVIEMHALNDEQALLAKVRYNRLIDIFTGVTCYSLQNHLRTTVPGIGQVETDELYVGLDRKGVHYILPVQAKGGRDKLNVVQIEQDMLLCSAKFPQLICRPIAAQFMNDDLIALFEFEKDDSEIKITSEKHYRLVPSENVTNEDLINYRKLGPS